MSKVSPKLLAQNDAFVKALLEMTTALCEAFANDENVITGLTQAKTNVEDLAMIAHALPARVQEYVLKWSAATNGEWIWAKDAAHLVSHVKNSDMDFLKQLNLDYLFFNPAAEHCREGLWARLHIVTRIASEFDDFQSTGKRESCVYGKSMPSPINMYASSSSAMPATAAAAPAPAPTPKMDPKQIQEALKQNLPAAFEVFKSLMSNKDGDNPIASIMQMMKDPKVVGSDMASNMAGLAMNQADDSTVLDVTEQSAVDSINQRIDTLEKDINSLRKDSKNTRADTAQILQLLQNRS